MLNQLILVGRIAFLPKAIEIENDKKVLVIKLAVTRAYKNVDGVYETDFIPVILYGNIAKNVVEYCREGDVISVKGRIEQGKNIPEIIAEKVTFLSSNRN